MTNTSKIFMHLSDVLQIALPVGVGLSDVYSDNKANAGKIKFIAILLFVQLSGTICIKKIVGKPRPCYLENKHIKILERDASWGSFPSGHMMVAMLSTTRVISKYGVFSIPSLLYGTGCFTVFMGRYLPKKHDVIDLFAGGLMGCLLGRAWNYGMHHLN